MAIEPGFEPWVLAHRSALLRTAWLLSGDLSTAEDLVQTALLRCWPRWMRISQMINLEAYVTQVITNVYLSGRRRRWTAEIPTGRLPDAPAVWQDDVKDDAALLTALARLPRRQRATLVLRFGNDLSERQTAQLMNCSVGTVKSQTARALRALRADPDLLYEHGSL